MNDETVWAVPSGELAGNEYFFYAFPPNCITFGKDFEYKSGANRWGGYLMPWEFYDTYDKADARFIPVLGEVAQVMTVSSRGLFR